MKVKQLMSHKPDYISHTLSVQKAAEEMLKRDIGFLPIGDLGEDRLIGVLTDRDIATRCVAQSKDPARIIVKDIMTPRILYCFEDDDIETAAKSMQEQQIHRLAVLNAKKRIVGVLSFSDIATRSHKDTLCGEIIEKVCEPNKRK